MTTNIYHVPALERAIDVIDLIASHESDLSFFRNSTLSQYTTAFAGQDTENIDRQGVDNQNRRQRPIPAGNETYIPW